MQNFVVHRRGEKVGSVELEALDGQIQVAVPGQHDHFNVAVRFLDDFQQINAGAAGHFDIGKDDVRAFFREPGQSLIHTGGGDDRVPGIRERNPQNIPDALLVVHQKKRFIHGMLSRAVGRRCSVPAPRAG